MQGIGFTDEIDAGELAALDHALTAELATIKPPAVEFRYLTVYPEAIYLKAHPSEALYPLRLKMHDAVSSVAGTGAIHRTGTRSSEVPASCQHRIHQPRW